MHPLLRKNIDKNKGACMCCKCQSCLPNTVVKLPWLTLTWRLWVRCYHSMRQGWDVIYFYCRTDLSSRLSGVCAVNFIWYKVHFWTWLRSLCIPALAPSSVPVCGLCIKCCRVGLGACGVGLLVFVADKGLQHWELCSWAHRKLLCCLSLKIAEINNKVGHVTTYLLFL